MLTIGKLGVVLTSNSIADINSQNCFVFLLNSFPLLSPTPSHFHIVYLLLFVLLEISNSALTNQATAAG